MKILAPLFLILCMLAPDLYTWQWIVVSACAMALIAGMSTRLVSPPILIFGIYLAGTVMYRVTFGVFSCADALRAILICRQTAFVGVVFLSTYVFRAHILRAVQYAVPLGAVSSLVGLPILYQNHSLNAAMLVSALPLMAHAPTVSTALVFCVVCREQSVTAFAMLGAYFGMRRKWYPLLGMGLIGAMRVWYRRIDWLEDSERIQFYRLAFEYFQEHFSSIGWFGSGLGSFIALAPIVQKNFSKGVVWGSMHSDWGQLLFETGIVGFALGLIAYADSLRRADAGVRQSLVLVGLCGLVYFPMQAPLFAFFCIWLVALTQPKTV